MRALENGANSDGEFSPADPADMHPGGRRSAPQARDGVMLVTVGTTRPLWPSPCFQKLARGFVVVESRVGGVHFVLITGQTLDDRRRSDKYITSWNPATQCRAGQGFSWPPRRQKRPEPPRGNRPARPAAHCGLNPSPQRTGRLGWFAPSAPRSPAKAGPAVRHESAEPERRWRRRTACGVAVGHSRRTMA